MDKYRLPEACFRTTNVQHMRSVLCPLCLLTPLTPSDCVESMDTSTNKPFSFNLIANSIHIILTIKLAFRCFRGPLCSFCFLSSCHPFRVTRSLLLRLKTSPFLMLVMKIACSFFVYFDKLKRLNLNNSDKRILITYRSRSTKQIMRK